MEIRQSVPALHLLTVGHIYIGFRLSAWNLETTETEENKFWWRGPPSFSFLFLCEKKSFQSKQSIIPKNSANLLFDLLYRHRDRLCHMLERFFLWLAHLFDVYRVCNLPETSFLSLWPFSEHSFGCGFLSCFWVYAVFRCILFVFVCVVMWEAREHQSADNELNHQCSGNHFPFLSKDDFFSSTFETCWGKTLIYLSCHLPEPDPWFCWNMAKPETRRTWPRPSPLESGY